MDGGNRINGSALVAVCPLLLAKLHSKKCCGDQSLTTEQEHAGKLPIGQGKHRVLYKEQDCQQHSKHYMMDKMGVNKRNCQELQKHKYIKLVLTVETR